jgi:hypothetical protein
MSFSAKFLSEGTFCSRMQSMKGCRQPTSIIMTSWPGCEGTGSVVGGAFSGMDGA